MPRRSFVREVSQASTVPADDIDPLRDLWAYFEPLNYPLEGRLDVKKGQTGSVTFGKDKDNSVVFCDEQNRIASRHCVINFRRQSETYPLEATLEVSSNAQVYVDYYRVGGGQKCILREGATICFVASSYPDFKNFSYMFHVVDSSRSPGFHQAYDLGHLISLGTCSAVRSAINRDTGDEYAVKILLLDKISADRAESVRQLATKEVRFMQMLRHPNICKIHDEFMHPGDTSIYIVMEYMKCGSLQNYALSHSETAQGGLAEQVARDIMYQICDATNYLHSMRVVHRDLNPRNILVAREDPPLVKICDFDQAKLDATFHKTCVGTQFYAAPELLVNNRRKGSKGYTRSVDAYSVGCIAYFILTLDHPFSPGSGNAHSLERHIQARKLDLGRLNAYKGTHVFDFIVGLLQTNPAHRPTMRAAQNHKWFNDYKPHYPVSLRDYDDGFGPASGLYRLSPRKKGALLTIIEESDDMDDYTELSEPAYDDTLDSMDFDDTLVDSDAGTGESEDIEMSSSSPATPLQSAIPLALRRSPRKNRGQHPNLLQIRYLC